MFWAAMHSPPKPATAAAQRPGRAAFRRLRKPRRHIDNNIIGSYPFLRPAVSPPAPPPRKTASYSRTPAKPSRSPRAQALGSGVAPLPAAFAFHRQSVHAGATPSAICAAAWASASHAPICADPYSAAPTPPTRYTGETPAHINPSRLASPRRRPSTRSAASAPAGDPARSPHEQRRGRRSPADGKAAASICPARAGKGAAPPCRSATAAAPKMETATAQPTPPRRAWPPARRRAPRPATPSSKTPAPARPTSLRTSHTLRMPRTPRHPMRGPSGKMRLRRGANGLAPVARPVL